MNRPAALAILALSCAGNGEDLFVPAPPPLPGARSLFVVVSDDGDGATVSYDLDAGGALPAGSIELVALAPWRLTAFYYDFALSELARPDDCALARPLSVIASDGGPWVVVDPSANVSLLVDEETCTEANVCRTFRVDSVPLLDLSPVRMSVRLDDERALIATSTGAFYEVTRSEATLATAYAGLPSLAAMIDGAGDLWLGGAGGRIVRGPIGGPFQDVELGAAETIVAIAERDQRVLAIGWTPSEMHAYELSPSRGFLGAIPVRESDECLVELAWLGDRAVASTGTFNVLVVEGDRVTEVRPAEIHPLGDVSFSSAATVAGVAYMGASAGRLYRSSNLIDWFLVDVTPLGTKTQAIQTLDRGIVFGSEEGVIGQYHPLTAHCPPEGLLPIEIQQMTWIGPRLLATGGSRELPRNAAYWLEPL